MLQKETFNRWALGSKRKPLRLHLNQFAFLGGSLSSKAITKHFIPTGKGDWYAPGNIEDLISVIDSVPLTSKYTFVGGNTGRGKEI